MHVFVTGATGFIGSAVVRELLDAGHQVVGLARSEAAAAALAAAGAQVRRGSLDDPAGLAEGAAAADGVIHTAYNHDFSDMAAAAATDRAAIEAMGDALAGSGRPLVVASGTALSPDRVVSEADAVPEGHQHPRRSEQAALPYAGRGVAVAALRLPPTVHGEGDHGFIPQIITIARQRGVSGYPGEGTNRWAAVHRLDAARVFRLALEAAEPGARWHAVAEQGVPVGEIAELIGRHLGLPVTSVAPDQAAEHFGWIGRFWTLDVPAASEVTRSRLGWTPAHQGLLADLEEGHYFKA